jgi:hypothetical protein
MTSTIILRSQNGEIGVLILRLDLFRVQLDENGV